ncbi:MAG: hypothetical protein ACYC2O_04840 [Microthrixaceae bacterium]
MTRWVGRVTVVLGLGCMAAGVVAPPAGANYGRIAAEARCDRNVSWVASASTEGTAAERTNDEVLVEYRRVGATSWSTLEDDGHFDADNDFSFSGTFELPDGVDAAEVRVTPQVAWGPDQSGDPAGSSRYATAKIPSSCGDQPLVATIAMDCDAGGAVVAVRNVGSTALEPTVAADRVDVRQLAVAPGATETIVVPVLDRTSAAIRVQSGTAVVAQEEVRSDCGLKGPAAVVVERCGARQAVVLAGTDGDDDVEASIRVAGTIVHRAEVRDGEVLRRTLELPADGAVPVEVELDGQVVANAQVGGCDAPVAGAATCGVADRPTCEVAVAGATTVPAPPPPPPPPLTVELNGSELAHTGPWQRAVVLLLGGALLVGGGAALVAEQRRRPRPSLLSSLVAPYRRGWWDEP